MSELLYSSKNIWESADAALKEKVMNFSEEYKNFLNNAPTERHAVSETIKLAKVAGFVDFGAKDTLIPGDKVYVVNRNKSVLFAIIGKQDITLGTNIIAAHIDAPRLDLKPVPLFEESGIAYLKTHYYGGIKKYQWTAIPLAMYGTVVTKDKTIEIEIGKDDDDLVFTVSDLLPHLATEQMSKKMSEGIEGEKLNLVAGSIYSSTEENKVKHAVMTILNDKYSITEEDFISGEFEIVPAFKARDVGLDRSMVGGYGQDDRVCSFAVLKAILELDHVDTTAICLLADKEEVGSIGNTGAKSMFLDNTISEFIFKLNKNYNDILIRRCLSNSKCISADVSAAYDFAYDFAYEKRNSAFLNHGLVVTKYTGSRGKSGSSDASAEFTGVIRNILNANNIAWQTAELGKIDVGGGGTIAQYISNLNIDVIDCGVALLSMHSPFEIAAKADIYMAYAGYKAFFIA